MLEDSGRLSAVLVTGGTGTVGGAVVRRLRSEGYRVRIFARHADRDTTPGVEFRQGDVQDFATVRPAMEGIDAVVHTVGILRQRRGQTFHGVHVQGTRNVVSAAEQAGVRRVIYIGGVNADPRTADLLSRTKGLAEEEVARSELDYTILRASMVFGAGFDQGVLGGIRRSLRISRPFAILPCKGKGLFQPLWVEDLTSCVVACLQRDGFSGRILELGGPDTRSYQDLVELVMRTEGLHHRMVSVPSSLIALTAGLSRLARIEPLVTPTELRQLCMDNRTDPDVLAQEFDILSTRLSEAYATASLRSSR